MANARCVRGLSAVLVLAAVLIQPAMVLASDQSAFGWQTTVRQTANPVPGAAHHQRRDKRSNAVVTETAHDLYSDAQMYVSLREWAAADRLLRAVIARFPDSAAATYARRDLAKLRRTIFGTATRSTLGGPIKPPRGSDAPSSRGRTAAPWTFLGQQDSLQDQFRSRVGDRLFFAAFSAALGTRNLETVRAQASWLAGRPETRVILEAHADEPGDRPNETGIAKARAEAVKAAFIRQGIAPGRISIVVFGRAKPVALCETPACRAQNRRVVVRVRDVRDGPIAQP